MGTFLMCENGGLGLLRDKADRSGLVMVMRREVLGKKGLNLGFGVF